MSTLVVQEKVKICLDEYIIPELIVIIQGYIYELPAEVIAYTDDHSRVFYLGDNKFANLLLRRKVTIFIPTKQSYVQKVSELPEFQCDVNDIIMLDNGKIVVATSRNIYVWSNKFDQSIAGGTRNLIKLRNNKFASQCSNVAKVWDIVGKRYVCIYEKRRMNEYFGEITELSDGSFMFIKEGGGVIIENIRRMCVQTISTNMWSTRATEAHDGSILYTSREGLCSWKNNKEKLILKTDTQINCFVELSDGNIMLGLGGGIIKNYNTKTGESNHIRLGRWDIMAINELPDGKIAFSYNCTVRFCDKNCLLYDWHIEGSWPMFIKNGSIMVERKGCQLIYA